jgi:hypothetical protein
LKHKGNKEGRLEEEQTEKKKRKEQKRTKKGKGGQDRRLREGPVVTAGRGIGDN